MNPHLAAAIARRTEAGLRLEFVVPGQADTFTCYAKDEDQKAAWLSKYAAKGWTLV